MPVLRRHQPSRGRGALFAAALPQVRRRHDAAQITPCPRTFLSDLSLADVDSASWRFYNQVGTPSVRSLNASGGGDLATRRFLSEQRPHVTDTSERQTEESRA